MKNKYYFISWNQFHLDCFKLAKKILAKKIKIDRIICISRGGLVVSRILSDFLNLPVSLFTIVGYSGINQGKQPQIVEGLKAKIRGETVLLVDEVADSGRTFILALDYLKAFKPKKIYTFAQYIKEKTVYIPDFWQVKINKWLIFPYEIKETIEQLKSHWKKEKINKSQMIKKLIDLGFKKDYLLF